jgi:hypothetical protein
MRPNDARRAGPWQESGPQKIAATSYTSLRRNAAVLVEDTTITVKGYVADVLLAARFKPLFVSTVGGFMVDRRKRGLDRLPDLLAALDAAGYHVTVTEAGDRA